MHLPGSGLTRIWSWLPRGDTLSEAVWQGRHRFSQVLLWIHIPFLFIVGIVNGEVFSHAVTEVGLIIVLATLSHVVAGRATRATVVAAGLLSSSALLVHFTGGLIESHFHFFVILPLVALYQDWRPFLVGILWVVVHHGVLGTLAPADVYNHPAALARPVLWAFIHALYVIGLVSVLILYWWFMEIAQRETISAQLNRRIAEEQSHRLQEENAHQAELGRMKNEFIASVSHELRTPLTAVVGFADLLRHAEELSDSDRKFMLDSLAREASDVAHLVEDLLVGARADAGELSVSRVPVDLRAQAAQVLESLEMAIGPSRARLIDPAEQTIRAFGDPARVRQILRNLITNAYRYGGEEIRVIIDQTEGAARVMVWDSGPGVPEIARERIFEAYERAHEHNTQPSSVGLGLAVSRKLARLMGGDLVCRVENGSIFEFSLPVADEMVLVGSLKGGAS